VRWIHFRFQKLCFESLQVVSGDSDERGEEKLSRAIRSKGDCAGGPIRDRGWGNLELKRMNS
jgi:hypothetical protein